MKNINEDEEEIRLYAYLAYKRRQKCGCITCQEFLNDKTDWELAKQTVRNLNGVTPEPKKNSHNSR